MKKLGSVMWGIVLVTIGVICGLNAIGLTHINIFFPGWWTMFIIVPCLIGLITDDDKSGSAIGLVVGTVLLLGCLDVIDFALAWKLILPAILVIIGVGMICKAAAGNDKARKMYEKHMREHRERIRDAEIVDEDETGYAEYWATFAGQRLDFNDKEYRDSQVEAIFGGLTLDLRQAKMGEESVLKATSIFGGIKVYVPEDVEVEVSSTAICGGVKHEKRAKKTEKDEKKSEKVKKLYIDATCIFGGVEII